jgi:hypothetical protein
LQSATSRPSILSLSYAWSEEEQCISLTDQTVCTKLKLSNAQYVARINTEFQKVRRACLSVVPVCALPCLTWHVGLASFTSNVTQLFIATQLNCLVILTCV